MKHLLNIHLVADTVLGAGDTKIVSHGPSSQGAHSLKEERQVNKNTSSTQ